MCYFAIRQLEEAFQKPFGKEVHLLNKERLVIGRQVCLPLIDQSLLREDVERLRVPTRCLVLPQRIEQQRVAKIFEQKETRIRVCAHQPRHDDTIRLKELTYEQKRLILF